MFLPFFFDRELPKIDERAVYYTFLDYEVPVFDKIL